MERLLSIKNTIFVVVGAVGGTIGTVLGGYSSILIALIGCMIIDYVTGLIVALVFKNSPKTSTGAAQSKAGLIGLIKKIFILLIIVMVNQIDVVLGSNGFLRNAAMIGFMANECLSIIENAGLMGIDLPPAVKNAIDILKKKSEVNNESQGAQ
ncbi:phage holin family protein [Clostridium sp. 'White wine YQ']|uniref:phage holin family protein n=1 Tax=Clostridium sp. 'White wine YQ' TaxID=3027474 RepID=UPI0023651045|nr:phage holin family protein [Clostridium sp. 'White wine YQ']MDD7793706.1 phage holin family protein [Clostridium sp. 'White wine YQ']